MRLKGARAGDFVASLSRLPGLGHGVRGRVPVQAIERPQAAALRLPPPAGVKDPWGGPAFP